MTEKIFNDEAAKISPLLKKLGLCSLSRVDPCLNIDLRELDFPCSAEQMMRLIKQGNIPKHYKERELKYDDKQHRKIMDKTSFYLESKSSVINYYLKYPQQDEGHPNYLSGCWMPLRWSASAGGLPKRKPDFTARI